MIIAVDFDGTIIDEHKHIRAIAASCIRRWRAAGHKVILWTCRQGKDLLEPLQLFTENGIEFDGVNSNLDPDTLHKRYGYDCRKIKYDYLIDDKCPFPVEMQFAQVNKLLGGK